MVEVGCKQIHVWSPVDVEDVLGDYWVEGPFCWDYFALRQRIGKRILFPYQMGGHESDVSRNAPIEEFPGGKA